ncbi:MAG TPA: enolase C-terminal domain-like protein [Pelomicrobium sp.]|nr:enolase C-terminal domain-like protein [Pelomicrobium sp.]
MAVIDRIVIHRLQVPLVTPYKLAFGPVTAFDTLIAELRDADGRHGFGEATLLTGYTDETIDGAWTLARELAPRLAGRRWSDAKAVALAHADEAPFTATLFASAVEMLEDHPALAIETDTRVPLLGVVNATERDRLEAEIEVLLSQGFETLKIKVGFDADIDARKVALIQEINAGRAQLRIDANQGYSADDGCRFARALSPEAIELFEQPCAAGDWIAAKAVAEVSPVPMMLDESIYGLEDIERAAQLKAARYIKLKLMKMGSLSRLEAGIDRIRALGMEPVLGNGVACEPGCWMEACIARRRIRNAGEMNGFLKPVARLTDPPLRFERGAIVLQAAAVPALDQSALARFRLGREEFAAAASAAV